MALPLMPKATAVWLIDNTSLSFEQIADFCGMHPLEVQGIADGEVATGIIGEDPVGSGQRAQHEAVLRPRGRQQRMRRLKRQTRTVAVLPGFEQVDARVVCFFRAGTKLQQPHGAGRRADAQRRTPSQRGADASGGGHRGTLPHRQAAPQRFQIEHGARHRADVAMDGTNPFIVKVVSQFVNMDKMIGKDFEEGLFNLKALVEPPPPDEDE